MKKLSIVAAIVMAALVSSTVKAQVLAAKDPLQSEALVSAGTATSAAAAKSAAAKLRAGNYFTKKYKDVNAQWHTDGELIIANFTDNACNTSVVFDEKGRKLRTMKIYSKDKVPANIALDFNRSLFRDHTINLVQAIEEFGVHFYIIHAQKGKSIKWLVLQDGMIEEYKSFIVQ